ncbi:MAG: ExbD/TolR family protein [Phycisphaerales bacterium JB063]
MGFAAESRERARPVLPLAGLVDVLFLLLIFVMSTYSMREQELMVDVGLPAMDSGEVGGAEGLKIIISFDAEGTIFLGQRRLTLDTLRGELQTLVEVDPDQTVIIRGDRGGDYGLFMEVLDTARSVGLEDIQLSGVGAE